MDGTEPHLNCEQRHVINIILKTERFHIHVFIYGTLRKHIVKTSCRIGISHDSLIAVQYDR